MECEWVSEWARERTFSYSWRKIFSMLISVRWYAFLSRHLIHKFFFRLSAISLSLLLSECERERDRRERKAGRERKMREGGREEGRKNCVCVQSWPFNPFPLLYNALDYVIYKSMSESGHLNEKYPDFFLHHTTSHIHHHLFFSPHQMMMWSKVW